MTSSSYDQSPVKAGALVREIASALASAGVEDGAREAELIVASVAGIGRVAMYRDDPEVSGYTLERVRDALRRRAAREPLAYVLGEAEFAGMTLCVGHGVLVPRPETEIIVEAAARYARKGMRVLDMCAGSGALALAIARAHPDAHVTGVDVSDDAMRYARRNLASSGLRNVNLLKGDMFDPLAGMRFDMIVTNPPYVPTGDLDGLMPEVSLWEPRAALDGGADGLVFYRLIVRDARDYLNPDGVMIMELGIGQAALVGALAKDAGLAVRELIRDLAGIERTIVLQPTT